jgi:AcrR family transcriptional regulator
MVVLKPVRPADANSTTVRPVFRRATAADAVELARSTFLANERVDMQTLAAQLGVARTTLHRWVGTREQLLDQVLDSLAGEFFDLARSEASGDDDEFVVDVIRRLVGTTSRFEPALGFAQREPELALRLLVGRRFSVRNRLLERLQGLIEETLPAREGERLAGFAPAIVEVGTALEWASVVAGDEPSSDRMASIARGLLVAARAGALATDWHWR